MRSLFLYFLFFLMGCSVVPDYKTIPYTVLGDLKSEHIWVYLCGLTSELTSPQESHNRALLDILGKKLHIKFVAIHPTHRCEAYDNKLCWPHESQEATLQTYQEIQHALGSNIIGGYIGFSNGGFFLNKLIQYQELHVPIVSIGAAGYMDKVPCKNTLYLLIGKQDVYHYEHVHNLYAQLGSANVHVALIEYEGGHEIPAKLVEELVGNL